MNIDEVKALLQRYRLGLCSEEEEAAINAWYDDMADSSQLILSEEDAEALNEKIKERVFKAIRKDEDSSPGVLRKMNNKLLRYAAAVTLFIALGSVAYYLIPGKTINTKMSETTKVHDGLPGTNKATLRLADGTVIELESNKNGLLADQGKTAILKVADGQIAYSSTGQDDAPVLINRITTPNAGQYAVVLSDGTKVWLNAASSLEFPNRFTGNERTVTLTGEGYFEVLHDDQHPFIVKTGETETHDIGTAFNINAYHDEPEVTVTLVEGKASVKSAGKEVELEPGYKAIVKHQQLKKQPANVSAAVAWKNGLFQFNDATIETVMRQIARWYDLQVEHRGNVQQRFNGSIYRNSNASDVIRILEENGSAHFKIEGNKIIVSP